MGIKLCENPSLTIIHGLKGSGKTHLLKFLLFRESQAERIDYVILFSPTSYQYKMIPEKYKKEFSEQYLEKLMKKHESNKKLKGLLVFDDCLGSVNFASKGFSSFMFKHRHFRISVIILAQQILNVSKSYLMNADFIFLFRFNNRDNAEEIYRCYFSECFEGFREFKEYWYKQFDQPYKFVFVSMNQYDLSKRYKTMRCPKKIPKYKLSY